jgi:hypothetical protein
MEMAQDALVTAFDFYFDDIFHNKQWNFKINKCLSW